MPNGFIKQPIEEFNNQQLNFCAKIGGYTFDKVEPSEILKIKADAKYLTWEIATNSLYVSYTHSWTTFGVILIQGPDGGIDGIAPPLPSVGVAPTAVHPGMRTRFSNIAADCKRSAGYTKAMGIDLGIEEVVTVFVPANGKPLVRHEFHVGHPFFRYTKDQYQGVQIYKNSNKGLGFVKFDKAVNATYTDNSALPAVGVAEVWQYKFVYLYQGVEVGNASAIVEVLVTGM